MIQAVRTVRAVGRVTLLEVLRDRVLYNTILVAFLLLGLGFVASRLSFLRPDRVILDFGLSAVSLSSSALAVLLGAALLGREFERRTLYVALSHPISRGQFVVGKFFGLAQVLLINWVLLVLSYLMVLGLSSYEGFSSHWTSTLLVGLALILAQSWVLASIAIFFSSFTTTSLSVVMSVGIYLIGTNISQLRLVAARMESGFGSAVLNAVSYLLPNLESFNLGLKVTYALPVAPSFAIHATLYASALIGVFLTASGVLVRRKEL